MAELASRERNFLVVFALGTFHAAALIAALVLVLYATGGLAYGHAQLNTNLVSPFPFTFPASASVTRVGWTAGAGVEWAFAGNWSAKLEGLYYDLGTTTLGAGPTVGGGVGVIGFVRSKDFELHGAIARLGLNYRFGGPVVAKY